MPKCIHEDDFCLDAGIPSVINFGKSAMWSHIFSQIDSVEGDICIATYSLPDIQFTQKILAKKTRGIQIIAHSKFFDRAYEIKEAFPEVHISLRDDIHAKFALIEPSTVWLLSANFGRSDWIEHAVAIHGQNVFDGFKQDFDKLFKSSEPVEILKPCPFCGAELKLRDKTHKALFIHGYQSNLYYINCPFCNAHTGSSQDTLKEAISVWNRRANHE